jgi:glycine/D-amino acid oxidase-like deaminating enzyme
MSPPVDPVASDSALPAHASVVVIGGGIIGVSTALFLAQKGHSVVVCEKGRIGGEQSSRNWGWCRTLGRDPREIPLNIESLRFWRDMNRLTGAETGFRQAGIVYLFDTEAQMATQEEWAKQAREYQIDVRSLRGAELAELAPGAARPFAGGMYTPADGRAEPSQAAPAIAEAARKLGAGIFTDCAVRGLETEGGRVAAAVTERGRIRCDAVVLAGGAWSRLFCGNLGVKLPQLKVLSSVMRTEALPGGPEMSMGASDFAFRKRLDGGYSIARRNASVSEIVPDSFRLLKDFLPAYRSDWRDLRLRLNGKFLGEWRMKRRWSLDEETPFEQMRVLDPAPSAGLLAEARENLSRAFPVFAAMRIAESWAGMIDVTPDAVPVISGVDTIPGFFIATGFSGHGFGIGPGAGRLMADLVAGDPPIVDPMPFRFKRFSDGAVLKPR